MEAKRNKKKGKKAKAKQGRRKPTTPSSVGEESADPPCGVKLTPEQQAAIEALKKGRKVQTLGIKSLANRWPNDIVYYEIPSSQFDSAQEGIIRQAIQTWQDATCLTFVETTSGHRIRFQSSATGCYSYVGDVRSFLSPQPINLETPGCIQIGIVLHEIGHSLGLYHEQNRPDRDDYVIIHFNNVIDGTNNNNFVKYTWDTTIAHGLPYDYGSIMHYGRYAFAIDSSQPTITPTPDSSVTIGQRTALSDSDIKIVNLMYSCPPRASPVIIEQCDTTGSEICATDCNWDQQVPRTCNGETGHICCSNGVDPCAGVVCQNGGTKTSTAGACCLCQVGFSGDTCQTDHCAQTNCNGGTKVPVSGGCDCSCPDGFSGNNCEIDICAQTNCNGGTKVPVSGGCDCSCPDGFSGNNCEIDICAQTNCNGGTKVPVSGGCDCSCPVGFSGDNCEIDHCAQTNCNGGTTVPVVGGCDCSCPVGFSGTNCEIDICQDCVDVGNGTPVRSATSCDCQCNLGYSGNNCEIDECDQCDSQGTASTTRTAGGCDCSCMPGWSGTNCATPPPCESSPITCVNGVPIVDGSGNCVCDCDDGWSGTNCDVDECANCDAEGTASTTPTDGGCDCTCQTGWSGTFCETDVCQACVDNGNGTPVRSATSCDCQCDPGFSGGNCEINLCSSTTCHNGGTPDPVQGGCQCVCADGFTGSDCSTSCPANCRLCNADGSVCSECNPGYTLDSTTGQCVENSEPACADVGGTCRSSCRLFREFSSRSYTCASGRCCLPRLACYRASGRTRCLRPGRCQRRGGQVITDIPCYWSRECCRL